MFFLFSASQPLNLDGVEYMTLDWHNKKNNKEHLMIESKSCLVSDLFLRFLAVT